MLPIGFYLLAAWLFRLRKPACHSQFAVYGGLGTNSLIPMDITQVLFLAFEHFLFMPSGTVLYFPRAHIEYREIIFVNSFFNSVFF